MNIEYKPDADRLIKYLKNKNVKLALATVSRRETIDIYVNENENMRNKCNLEKYFEPNPEVYNKIIDKFKIDDLSKCLVVEDSLTGVMAAKNANLDVIVVYDKYADKDREKLNEMANYNVKNYKELIDIFETCKKE